MNINLIVKRLVSGIGIRTIYFIVNTMIAFIMMPYMIQSLGMIDYGLWALLSIIVGYMSYVDVGLASAVGRFVSKSIGSENYDDVNVTINTAFSFYMLIGLILSIIVFFTSDYVHFIIDYDDTELIKYVFLLLGIGISLQLPFRSFSGILSANLRYDTMVYIDSIKLFIKTIGVLLILGLNYGLYELAILSFITELAVSILFYWFSKRECKYLKFSFKYIKLIRLKDLYSYGVVSFVAVLANVSKTQSIFLMVSVFHSLEAVTLYAVGVRLYSYIQLFMNQITSLTTSLISRYEGEGDIDKIKITFEQSSLFTTVIALLMFVIVFNNIDSFMILWMGVDFIVSALIVKFLVIALSLDIMTTTFDNICYGLSKHKFVALLDVLFLIVFILTSILFRNDLISVAVCYMFATILMDFIAKPVILSRCIFKDNIVNLYKIQLVAIAKLLPFVIIGIYLYIMGTNFEGYIDMLKFIIIYIFMYLIFAWFVVIPKSTRKLVFSSFNGG